MIALFLSLLAAPATAQTPIDSTLSRGGAVNAEHAGGPFGLGLAVGAPTGVAGKLWLGDWSAFQFSAGGDVGVFQDLAVTADYVLQFRPFDTGEPDVSVPLHIGAGVNLGGNFWENITGMWFVGPRAVLGMSVMMKDLPLDIFFEVAPTVYLIEKPGWSIDGQIGIRHYL